MAKISIIIPIYKVEAYIQRCMESVMNQVWDSDEVEIECILVDDCTPDNSMLMAQDMIKAYQGPIHFICLRHERNRGLSAARNTGTAEATGDYILYIDSDDYLAPNSLKTFVDYIKKYPDVDVIMGQVVKTPSNEFYSNKTEKTLLYTNQFDIVYHFLNEDFYISAWNKLIKHEILTKQRIYFIEGIIFEDNPWMYNLFSYIKSVLIIPDVTYYYALNNSGITASATEKQYLGKAVSSYTSICNYILNNPLDSKISQRNMTIEYLLYVHTIMTRGLFFLLSGGHTKVLCQQFKHERSRLLQKVIKSKRIPLLFLSLFLYKPFSFMYKIGSFRKNFYYMRGTIRKLSHYTDFMH